MADGGIGKDLNDANESSKGLKNNMDGVFSSARQAAQETGELLNDSRNITEELKSQLGVRTKLAESDKSLLDITKGITKQIQKNVVLSGQSGKIGDLIKGNEEKILQVTQERSSIESTLGGLKDQEISKAKEIAQANTSRINAQKSLEGLEQKMAKDSLVASGKRNISLEKQIQSSKDFVQTQENSFESIVKGASKDAQKLAILNEIEGVAEKNLKLSQIEGDTQSKKNKLLGISGNLLKGLNKTAGSIGTAFGLDEVATEMNDVADAIARSNREGGKLTVMGAGLKKAFDNLGNNLFSPEAIFTALITGFKAVDKEATGFARQTGEEINTIGDSVDSLNMGYVNMADYIKAASALTKDLGMNAKNIFEPEDLIEVSQMTDEIGLSAGAATKLAKFSALNGKSVRSSNESITEGVKSANSQNKTAYNTQQILEDIGNTSQGIAVSYAGYPKKLGEAATAAKSLGMNLDGVDKIASSLLSFESSISAELEAELMTGKSLNLEKARQAALNNDLATVATEITKQVGSSADFAKMNRKEQEALAKAVGMQRDELAGSLVAKEMEGKLTTEHLSTAQKATYEAHKNREAQEKIAKSIAKIGEAFAPIIEIVADLVAHSGVIYAIMGIALFKKLGGTLGIVSKVGTGFRAIGSGATSFFGVFKKGEKEMSPFLSFFKKGEHGISGMKKKWEGLKASFKGGTDLVGDVKDKVGDAKDLAADGKDIVGKAKGVVGGADEIKKSADKTKGVKGNLGKQIKEFLEGLGDGLAHMGKKLRDIAKGALAIGLTGLALGGSFALAMMMIKDVDPSKMLAFSGSLSMLGLTVAMMGKVGKDIIKGALAMGILAISLIPAAYAFSLLAGVDPGSIINFALALPILGLSVLGLGLIFTNPFTMFLFGAGILGLLALGAALIPLASAFGKIGNSMNGGVLESTFTSLLKLSNIAPGILETAEALHQVAGGLQAISDVGITSLPSFNSNDQSNSEMSGVEKKLDTLIALVERGGDVYMDGAKVGKALQLSVSKVG